MVLLNNIIKLKQANIETDLAKVLDFEKVLNETKKNRPWHEHGLFGMIPGLSRVEEGIKDLASTGLGYLGEPLEKRELSLQEHANKYSDLTNRINQTLDQPIDNQKKIYNSLREKYIGNTTENPLQTLINESGIHTMNKKDITPTGIIPDYQNAYNSLLQHDNFSSDVGTLGTMGLLGGAGYAAYKGAGAIKNVLAKKSLGLAKELAETNMIPEHQIEEVAGSMFDRLHQHVMEHKLSYAGGIGAGVAGIGLTANHLINNQTPNDYFKKTSNAWFQKTLKEQLGQGDYSNEKTAGFSHKSKLQDLNKKIELESLKQRLNEIHQNPLTNKDIADKIEGAVNNLGDRISGELSGNRKVKIDAINAVGDNIYKNVNLVGEHAGKSLAEVAKTLAPYSPHIALGLGALGVGYAANSLFGNNK